MAVRPALLLLLLALPTAGASVDKCAEQVCASSWSAKDGSCGGAGWEQNRVSVNATQRLWHPYYLGMTNATLSTSCVRSGEETYHDVRFNASSQGHYVYFGWHESNGVCWMVLLAPDVDERRDRARCPPTVPALAP